MRRRSVECPYPYNVALLLIVGVQMLHAGRLPPTTDSTQTTEYKQLSSSPTARLHIPSVPMHNFLALRRHSTMAVV